MPHNPGGALDALGMMASMPPAAHLVAACAHHCNEEPREALEQVGECVGKAGTHHDMVLAATILRVAVYRTRAEYRARIEGEEASVAAQMQSYECGPAAARLLVSLGGEERLAIAALESEIVRQQGKGLPSPDLHAVVGEMHERLGDNKAAMLRYKAALSIHPLTEIAILGQARLTQRNDEAVLLLTTAVKNGCHSPHIFLARAGLRMMQNQVDLSIRDLREAVKKRKERRWMPKVPLGPIAKSASELLGVPAHFLCERYVREGIELLTAVLAERGDKYNPASEEISSSPQPRGGAESARCFLYLAALHRLLGEDVGVANATAAMHAADPTWFEKHLAAQTKVPQDLFLAQEHIWVPIHLLHTIIDLASDPLNQASHHHHHHHHHHHQQHHHSPHHSRTNLENQQQPSGSRTQLVLDDPFSPPSDPQQARYISGKHKKASMRALMGNTASSPDVLSGLNARRGLDDADADPSMSGSQKLRVLTQAQQLAQQQAAETPHTSTSPRTLLSYYAMLLKHYMDQKPTGAVRADWFMHRASLALLDRQQLPVVLADTREAMKLTPGLPDPYIMAADIHYVQLEVGESLSYYSRAIALLEGNAGRRADLDRCLVQRASLHRLVSNYAEARADLEAVLKEDPLHQAACWQLAMLCMCSGRAKLALEPIKCLRFIPGVVNDFSLLTLPGRLAAATGAAAQLELLRQKRSIALSQLEAAELSPDPRLRCDIFFSKSLAHLASGQVQECRKDLERVLALESAYIGTATLKVINLYAGQPFASAAVDDRMLSKAYSDRGVWLEEVMMLPKEAFGDYLKACDLFPGNRKAHTRVALLYKDAGNMASALPHLDVCVELGPGMALPYHYRGLIHMRLGNLDLALADFTALTKLVPREPGPLRARAQLLIAKKNYGAAVADLTQALQLLVANGAPLDTVGGVRLQLGDVHVVTGRHNEALAEYAGALSMQRSAAALTRRAKVLLALKRYEAAIEDFSQVIDDSPECLYLRGRCFHALGRHSEALRDYKASALRIPSRTGLYNNIGCAHLALGEEAKALTAFEAAIAANPQDRNAHFNRGLVLRSRGKLDEAVGAFSAVVRVDVRAAEAYFQRGMAFFSAQQVPAAMEDFEQVLRIQPNHMEAQLRVGVIHQAAGRREEAIALYNKVLAAKNGAHPLALAYRGYARALQGDPQAGLDDLNRAIMLSPQLHVAYHYRGLVHQLNSNIDLATEDLLRSLEGVAHEDGGIHSDVGMALLRQGRNELALEHLYKACALSPDSARVLTNRGIALLKFGSNDAAQEDFETALRLDKNMIDARCNLGVVLLEHRNDIKQALENFEGVLRAQPGHVPSLFNSGNALLATGDLQGAILMFNRAEAEIGGGAAGASNAKPGGSSTRLTERRANSQAALTSSSSSSSYETPLLLAEVYSNRGVCHHKGKHLGEALLDYNRALSVNPALVHALVNRGQLHMAQQNFQLAFRDFHEALKLKGNLGDPVISDFLELSRTWARIWQAAAEDFTYAVSFNPEISHLNFEGPNLDLNFFDARPVTAKELRDGFAEIDAELKVSPSSMKALSRRVLLALRAFNNGPDDPLHREVNVAKVISNSLPYATRALYVAAPRQFVFRAKMHCMRARIMELTGDVQGAIGEVKAASRMDGLAAANLSLAVSILIFLGYLCERAGDELTALASYTSAIELDPRSIVGCVNRATLRKRRGEYSSAMLDFLAVTKRLSHGRDPNSLLGQTLRQVYHILQDYRITVERGLDGGIEVFSRMQGSLAVVLEDFKAAAEAEAGSRVPIHAAPQGKNARRLTKMDSHIDSPPITPAASVGSSSLVLAPALVSRSGENPDEVIEPPPGAFKTKSQITLPVGILQTIQNFDTIAEEDEGEDEEDAGGQMWPEEEEEARKQSEASKKEQLSITREIERRERKIRHLSEQVGKTIKIATARGVVE
jgi:tetratricopeptide (TPR) repeat protein